MSSIKQTNQTKTTRFRTWKSGKKWLCAASTMALLLGTLMPNALVLADGVTETPQTVQIATDETSNAPAASSTAESTTEGSGSAAVVPADDRTSSDASAAVKTQTTNLDSATISSTTVVAPATAPSDTTDTSTKVESQQTFYWNFGHAYTEDFSQGITTQYPASPAPQVGTVGTKIIIPTVPEAPAGWHYAGVGSGTASGLRTYYFVKAKATADQPYGVPSTYGDMTAAIQAALAANYAGGMVDTTGTAWDWQNIMGQTSNDQTTSATHLDNDLILMLAADIQHLTYSVVDDSTGETISQGNTLATGPTGTYVPISAATALKEAQANLEAEHYKIISSSSLAKNFDSQTEEAGVTASQNVVIHVVKKATGTVTTHYVDESGNPLAADVTSSGYEEDSYMTAAKDIEGYVLKTRPANATGSYTAGNIDVTYVYVKPTGTTPSVPIVTPDNPSGVIPSVPIVTPDNPTGVMPSVPIVTPDNPSGVTPSVPIVTPDNPTGVIPNIPIVTPDDPAGVMPSVPIVTPDNPSGVMPSIPIVTPGNPDTTIPGVTVVTPDNPNGTTPTVPVVPPRNPNGVLPNAPILTPGNPGVTMPGVPVITPDNPNGTTPTVPVVPPRTPDGVLPNVPVVTPDNPSTNTPSVPVVTPDNPNANIPTAPILTPSNPSTNTPSVIGNNRGGNSSSGNSNSAITSNSKPKLLPQTGDSRRDSLLTALGGAMTLMMIVWAIKKKKVN